MYVEASRWTGIGALAPESDLSEDELTQEGCTYMFFTMRKWMSMGGEWDDTGTLRWQPGTRRGVRKPGQRRFRATATVAADGTLR